MRDEIGERVAEPSDRRHDAGRKAADQRMATPRKLAVVRKTLGKAHGNASTQRSG